MKKTPKIKAYWMIDRTAIEEFYSLDEAEKSLRELKMQNGNFINIEINDKNVTVSVADIYIATP